MGEGWPPNGEALAKTSARKTRETCSEIGAWVCAQQGGNMAHACTEVCAWVCMGVGSTGDACECMHRSPASAMSTLKSHGVGLIHLSIHSSNIFYYSEVPSRELGTERCPRKSILSAFPEHQTKCVLWGVCSDSVKTRPWDQPPRGFSSCLPA